MPKEDVTELKTPQAPERLPEMMPVRVMTREEHDIVRDAVREAPYRYAAQALAILDNSPTVNVPVVRNKS